MHGLTTAIPTEALVQIKPILQLPGTAWDKHQWKLGN